jgi:hypothetical protein
MRKVVTRVGRAIISVFASALAITTACRSGSDNCFPLELGSRWTYNATYGSSQGTFTISVTEVDGIRHFAKGVTQGDVSLQDIFPFCSLDNDTNCYYTVSGDTIWLGSKDYVAPTLVLVQPVSVGVVWRYPHWSDYDSAQVLSKVDVSVPAGTYTGCYKIGYGYYGSGEASCYVWYAPGVGAVKGETSWQPGPRFELVSADLP